MLVLLLLLLIGVAQKGIRERKDLRNPRDDLRDPDLNPNLILNNIKN
jgi:hypothetical protein